MLQRLVRVRAVRPQCRQHLPSYNRNVSTDATALSPARTRFAPSPTGYLHLGSLRTALFNYLWAKRTGGQFILRIEDTDVKRTVPGAEQSILDDLRWLGLQWDEGPEVNGPYGPYRQSERVDGDFKGSPNIYKQHALKLVESGHAYRCFCDPADLASRAKAQLDHGLSAEYDGKCLHLSAEESQEMAQHKRYIVRMKNDPAAGAWDDLVFGRQGGQDLVNKTQSPKRLPLRNDYVLLKQDGWPTYHLASVVDDWYMKITHVIRGVEWLKSTPKHVELYRAFGWQPPNYAHVGLLRDTTESKLSKRDLKFDLKDIKKNVLPEALTNFLVLLGWKQDASKVGRSEVYTMAELIESFDLQLNRTNPIVTMQKLQHLQGKHFKRRCRWDTPFYDEQLNRLQLLVGQRFTAKEMADVSINNESDLQERIKVLFQADKFEGDAAWIAKHSYAFSNSGLAEHVPVRDGKTISDVNALMTTGSFTESSLRSVVLTIFDEHFGANQDWSQGSVREWNSAVIDSALELCLEGGDVDHPQIKRGTIHGAINTHLRQWVAWGQDGQGMVDIMFALGRDVCRRRIERGTVTAAPEVKAKQSAKKSNWNAST